MNKSLSFHIIYEEKERLDLFLATKLSSTRNNVQHLIKSGCVTVNSYPSRASYIIKKNDLINVELPQIKETGLLPQNISLNIIFEDKDLIVINKPPGLVVHPAKGHEDNTLVNAILFHCPDLKGINYELRPGIVHRLDKDTSGIIVVAKNEISHFSLAEQFKQRKMIKEYIALVKGIPDPPEGTINAPIGRHPVHRKKMAVIPGGREAITNYKVENKFKIYSLLKIKPKTGRTHQIRVHLSYKGYPIIGDPLYGKQKLTGLERQALHAQKLSFNHPVSGDWLEFEAPLAEDIQKVLDKLKEE